MVRQKAADPTTVTLIFGGLCLFVQRPDKTKGRRGLFALLPHACVPGMRHQALLVYSGVHSQNSQDQDEDTVIQVPILNKEWVFQPNGGAGATKPFIPGIPPVSRYAGCGVSSDACDKPLPFPRVAARVVLDLGLDIQPASMRPASLNFTFNGRTETRSTQGLVGVQFQINQPTLSIFDEQLQASEGQIVAGIFNVLNGDIHPPQVGHTKGEPQHHFQAYYWLHGLDDGPIPTAAQSVDAGGNPVPDPSPNVPPPAMPMGESMHAGSELQGSAVSEENTRIPGAISRRLFVDPYQCTVGGGCPDYAPTC